MAKKKSAEASLKEKCDGLMQDLANETGGTITCGDGSVIAPEGEATEAEGTPAKPSAEVLAKVIADTVDEITRFMPRLRASEEEHDDAQKAAKDAKKTMEGNHLHLSMLCRRLADAKNGNYQPLLFDAPTKSLPLADDGAAMAIGVLKDYGLTEKMCETLVEHDFPTIGALEAAMRADEWWHQKIKGFGEERVTKLIDALTAFRAECPMPTNEDAESEAA